MSILLFLAVLVALIVVHEWGHFLAARLFRIRVEEFGIGYPPRAWRLGKWGDTEYTLNWLPFGGFVRIFGEALGADVPKSERRQALVTQVWWKQAVVFVAGVTFNVLFAWLLFTITFIQGAPVALSEQQLELGVIPELAISAVVSGSPADIAGLQAGDIVHSLSVGTTVLTNPLPSTVRAFVSEHAGEHIELTYSTKESTEQQTAELTPAHGILSSTPGTPAIGIEMLLISHSKRSVGEAVVLGVEKTYTTTILTAVGTTHFLVAALTGNAHWESVAGPIGIASLVGDASALGLQALLNFVAVISVNLAIINMLPVPALDGGRLLFVLIEAATHRKIPGSVAGALNMVGFAAIILLMLIISYHDVANIAL